jgi:uncharacterized repeat protein (TIGR01451 family)
MKRLVVGSICASVVLVSGFGCTDATDVELLEITASGSVVGEAYLDLNGTRFPDAGDVALSGVAVFLSSAIDRATVATAQTEGDGIFVFENVPIGSYIVRIDDAVLGDSLVTVGPEINVQVTRGEAPHVVLGLSYPVLTVEEIRAAVPGRKVFTSGIALNTRRTFSEDHRIFIEGATAYLQATNVLYTNPPVAAGDSVRFLGRTVSREGQPMLDEVTPIILVPQARVTQPQDVATATAASADGGRLDASLVRLRNAEIRDTVTSGGDFFFSADDGSGPIRVVVRSFLGRGTSDLGSDTLRVEQAVGMLSPHDDGSGTTTWRLLVRSAGELVTETREADLSVTASFQPSSASQGETVELTLIVANAGPLAATGVEVADTLHTALSRQSSSTTQGSYSSSGIAGLWNVPRIEPGRADTLRVTVQVTGAETGTVSYIARAGGLDREVDPVGENSRATAALTLTAP